MGIIEQTREQGVSLCRTFVVMRCISIALTALLLSTVFQTIQSYKRLSDAKDVYIDLQDAANSLMKASDYLRDDAQCYSVPGDRVHRGNQFTEAEKTRLRDLAIEAMERGLPDSDALAHSGMP